jgi:phosphoesterase RecJ-like protein
MKDGIFSVIEKEDSFVLTSHDNADVDGCACIVALFEILEKKGKKVSVFLPSISSRGKKLLSRFNRDFSQEKGDGFVMALDTQRGEFDFAIDHHFEREERENTLVEERTSCSEIILDLFKKELSKDSLLALLTGIVSDSGSFHYADTRTFESALWIMQNSDHRISDCYEILSIPKDDSERIAKLKAASRLRMEQIGEFILAVSKVGSFESSAASALVRLGADISLVKSKKGKKFRFTSRCREKVPIHLGEIMSSFGQGGGGHKGAAGINTEKDIEEEILSKIRLQLKN